ncbi:hypothetical protein BDZ89DRAFT_1035764 [Hymenopellis radicata]|nr:hypothetical protein BDZ89DRAFT_1035764 [Hymenopellis radicata]
MYLAASFMPVGGPRAIAQGLHNAQPPRVRRLRVRSVWGAEGGSEDDDRMQLPRPEGLRWQVRIEMAPSRRRAPEGAGMHPRAAMSNGRGLQAEREPRAMPSGRHTAQTYVDRRTLGYSPTPMYCTLTSPTSQSRGKTTRKPAPPPTHRAMAEERRLSKCQEICHLSRYEAGMWAVSPVNDCSLRRLDTSIVSSTCQVAPDMPEVLGSEFQWPALAEDGNYILT